MGFGILFLGYLLLFIFKGADIFPDVLAYAVILLGMFKLSKYNIPFKKAMFVMYPLLTVAAANDTFQILKLFGYEFDSIGKIVSVLNSLILVVFYYFLLMGIHKLAIEVDNKKIAFKAKRNWYITLVYSIVSIILSFNLSIPFMELYAKYIGIAYMVFGLLWIVLNGILIFTCYMWICLEGDENMPEKPKSIKSHEKKSEDE